MSSIIIELKAKIGNIKETRKKLLDLGAQYVGKYNQLDTYFKVTQGRLKIRDTEGVNKAEIVFYERENIPEIKDSRILLIHVQPPEIAKKMFTKIFQVKVIVHKIREIYKLEKTQVHLDSLTKLGTFIEFELPTLNEINEINKSKLLLQNYCNKLEIRKEDFQALSYSDLIIAHNRLDL